MILRSHSNRSMSFHTSHAHASRSAPALSGSFGHHKLVVHKGPGSWRSRPPAAHGLHQCPSKETEAADVGAVAASSPSVHGRRADSTTEGALQRNGSDKEKPALPREEAQATCRFFQGLRVEFGPFHVPGDESDLLHEGAGAELQDGQERMRPRAESRHLGRDLVVGIAHDLQQHLRKAEPGDVDVGVSRRARPLGSLRAAF